MSAPSLCFSTGRPNRPDCPRRRSLQNNQKNKKSHHRFLLCSRTACCATRLALTPHLWPQSSVRVCDSRDMRRHRVSFVDRLGLPLASASVSRLLQCVGVRRALCLTVCDMQWTGARCRRGGAADLIVVFFFF